MALRVLVMGLVVVLAGGRAEADCPSLPSIQRVAERTLGVGEAGPSGRRARWSALAPTVVVRGGQRLGWEETSGDRLAAEPVDRAQTVELRLTWRLDRLIFHPDEARLDSADRRRRAERVRVLQEVATAYVRWRRAELARASSEEAALDAELAFAQLDAYTAGWLRQACR